jgi:hypothetical protein
MLSGMVGCSAGLSPADADDSSPAAADPAQAAPGASDGLPGEGPAPGVGSSGAPGATPNASGSSPAAGNSSRDGAVGDPSQTAPGASDPLPGEGPAPSEAAACAPGAAPEAPLLRINQATYARALEDVFGAAAVDAIRPTLEALPSARVGTYVSQLAPPGFGEVESYVEIASALAFELTRDAEALGRLSPCLAELGADVDAAANECLGQWVQQLAPRLLRAPLSDEKKTELLSNYAVGGNDSAADGVATLLMALLVDPQFLYFLEVNGEEAAAGVLTLSSYEVAARLARVLWNSVPDDELMAAASQGLEPASLTQQVERMWDDPKASVALGRFFGDWLELQNLPYPAASFAPDAATQNSLRQAMLDEVQWLIDEVVMKQQGTYADLLLERQTNVTDPLLAAIYGTEIPEGTEGTDGTGGTGLLSLPEGQRAGLLTRAGWLSTMEIPRSDAGHVIKRGVKLSHFICRPLPPPDPDAFPSNDPADPASGPAVAIRERFQMATSEVQCNACHQFLDSYGAPFGNYGSAGQWIEVETVSDESGGSRELALDTEVLVNLDGVQVPTSNAVELSQALAQSGVGRECLARQFTQYTLGREVRQSEGCVAQPAVDVLANPDPELASIRSALAAFISSDAFARRSLIPGEQP